MSIDDGSAVAAVTYKIQGYISQHPRQNVTEQSEVTLGQGPGFQCESPRQGNVERILSFQGRWRSTKGHRTKGFECQSGGRRSLKH